MMSTSARRYALVHLCDGWRRRLIVQEGAALGFWLAFTAAGEHTPRRRWRLFVSLTELPEWRRCGTERPQKARG